MQKNQSTNYMDQVLGIITINSNIEEVQECTMGQETHPYQICDVPLPQCNTGCLYMLISLNDLNLIYIGIEISIKTRLLHNNYGVRAVDTEPLN